jgi:hypothetical protein
MKNMKKAMRGMVPRASGGCQGLSRRRSAANPRVLALTAARAAAAPADADL